MQDPTQFYRQLARAKATQYGIDPDIFERQIGQESGFNPIARSAGGAFGIAQIIPKWHPGVDVWDPDEALGYAASLVAGHLQRYGGDIRKALTAYHAGPGTLDKALSIGGGAWERFIEQAAAAMGFAGDAARIGRDNRTYLTRILGGGPTEPPGEEEQRLVSAALPTISTETEAFPPEPPVPAREVLRQVSKARDDPPDGPHEDPEPFPGYHNLMRPHLEELERLQRQVPQLGVAHAQAKEGAAPRLTDLLSQMYASPILGGIAALLTGRKAAEGILAKRQEMERLEEEQRVRQELAYQQGLLFLQAAERRDTLVHIIGTVGAYTSAWLEPDPEVRQEGLQRIRDTMAKLSERTQAALRPLIDVVDSNMGFVVPFIDRMTPEQQQSLQEEELTKKLLERRYARGVGSHELTRDQLRMGLIGFRSPGPTEERTGKALAEMLAEKGFDEEVVARYRESLQSHLDEWEVRTQEIEANRQALKYDLEENRLPRPGLGKYLKMAVTQPLVAATEVLDKYFRAVVHPIAGAERFMVAALFVPGEQEIERAFMDALRQGNVWTAAGEAHRSASMNRVARFGVETVADPTTLVGFGLTRFIKGVPIIGRLAYSAEMGYIKMVDYPFLALKRGLAKLPQTTVQRSLAAQSEAMRTAAALLERTTLRKLRRIPPEEARRVLKEAANRSLEFPVMDTDLAVSVGKMMRIQSPITAKRAAEWAERVGGTLTERQARESKIILPSLTQHMEDAASGLVPDNLVARQLTALLGLDDNAQNMRKLSGLIGDYKAGVELGIAGMLGGDTASSMVSRIGDRAGKIITETSTSIAAVRNEQAGMIERALRITPGIAAGLWSVSIERFIVRPLAKAYLVFTMYHLWNIAETYGKLGAAGMNPFVKARYSHVLQNLDEFGDAPSFIRTPGKTMALGEDIASTPGQVREKLRMGLAGEVEDWYFRSGLPNQMQDHLQAYYRLTQSRKQMSLINPGLVESVERTAHESLEELVGQLPKHLQQNFREAYRGAYMRNPRAVREMIDSFTVERIKAEEVNKLLLQYDQIPSPVSQYGSEQLRTGPAWNDLDSLTSRMEDLVWEGYMQRPEFQIARYGTFLEELMTAEIKTADDFWRRIKVRQAMHGVMTEVVEMLDDAARQRSLRTTSAAQNDAIYNLARKQETKFFDEVRPIMEEYDRVLMERVPATGVAVEDARTLLQRYHAREQIWTTAYAKRRAIDHQRFTVEGRPRGKREEVDAWWRETIEMRYKPIADAKKADEGLFEALSTYEMNIGNVQRFPVPDMSGRAATRVDVATLFGIRLDDVSAMVYIPESYALLGKSKFTSTVMSRVTAQLTPGQSPATLGWTRESVDSIWDDIIRELRADPNTVTMLHPIQMQLEDMRQGLHSIKLGASLPPGLQGKAQDFLEASANRLEKVGGYWQPGRAGAPGGQGKAWLDLKEQAVQKANSLYYIDFPDYLNTNVLDQFMRAQYPYWTYEFHRAFWLPRQFLRTPGLGTGIGRYYDLTEDTTYLHVPGTSLEINPGRGSILMGGMRRLFMRDYPEYYDQFPGMINALDYASRFGFYPGAHMTAFNMIAGLTQPAPLQLGEIMPSMVKTPILAFQAAAAKTDNQRLIDASSKLAQLFLSERFRDVVIQREVIRMGEDGARIWRKRKRNEPLTEAEQDAWDQADRNLAPTYLLMEQTAMFRFRPEELNEAVDVYFELVSAETGFTVDELRWLRNWGYRWEDFVPPDPEFRQFLNQTDYIRRWAGTILPLEPHNSQQLRIRINTFWDRVEDMRGQRAVKQQLLDDQFLTGVLDPDDWEKRGRELSKEQRNLFQGLRAKGSEFEDVPVTMEELTAYYKENGIVVPTFHPLEELKRMYYQLEPVERIDPVTGKLFMDWDTFYTQREVLLDAAGPDRAMLERIMEKNLTDLQRIHRETYRQYVGPYFNRREVVMEQFPEEQQHILRRWMASGNTIKRDELEQVQWEGSSLVGAYRELMRISSRNYRFFHPTADAWLNFWRKADSFASDVAEERYKELLEQMEQVGRARLKEPLR